MMEIISLEDALDRIQDKKLVIVGAGYYGKRMCLLLRSWRIQGILFGDNDNAKVGTVFCNCDVKAISELIDDKNYTWLIPIQKCINGYGMQIYSQIKGEVSAERLLFIDVDSLYINSDADGLKKTREYFNAIINSNKTKELLQEIKTIKGIVFRQRPKKDIANGPGGVLRTQESLLGDTFEGMQLKYVWSNGYRRSESLEYRAQDIIDAIEFGKKAGKEEDNTVYIVHDIFTAAGLATEGKHYALVYHQQGEVLFEKRSFGTKVYDDLENDIKQVELYAIKCAEILAFPSKGARDFFWKCFGLDKKIYKQYQPYEPMYNTLNENLLKINKPVQSVYREDGVHTFLSVGQMTKSKGVDRVMKFLNTYSMYSSKNVRWILVADGPDKDNVIKESCKYENRNPKLSFLQFDRLDHEQINYLLQISDAYIMLHRLSIFDIATLEAMYNNLTIILSDVEGNREFSRKRNILLYNDNKSFDYTKIENEIENKMSTNRIIYNNYFGNIAFEKRYKKMMLDLCGLSRS